MGEIQGYTGGIERVIFACFDAATADIYRSLLVGDSRGSDFVLSLFRILTCLRAFSLRRQPQLRVCPCRSS